MWTRALVDIGIFKETVNIWPVIAEILLLQHFPKVRAGRFVQAEDCAGPEDPDDAVAAVPGFTVPTKDTIE